MKKFDELSEHITEDEYRNNGRFHYSDIAGYLRNGFSGLTKKDKEDSDSIMFGSLVDCLVTQGRDEFDKRYTPSIVSDLSDNQKSVTKALVELGYESFDEVNGSVVIDLLDEMDLYRKFRPETRILKILGECGDYFKFLVDSKGKIVVSQDMYNDALDLADILVGSKNTSTFFDSGLNDGLDRYFQLKFNGTYNNIPITCMVDETIVDHENRKVWLVDLKTTSSGYEYEFPKSFVKWRYDIQCRMYSYIVRQVMDSDSFYKDYELCGFIFVYASRTNKTPLIWTFDNIADRDPIEIGNMSLSDFTEPLKEIRDIVEKKLVMPEWISIDGANDIIFGLNKFYKNENKDKTI